MNKLENLKLSYYFEVYSDNKLLYVFENDVDLRLCLEKNLDYKIVKKECFEYYYDINYDDIRSYGIVILNIKVNNEKKRYIFKNSEGFSLCMVHYYYKENNIDYELESIVKHEYSYNDDLNEEIIIYKKNYLVDKLLTILNGNNIGIIMGMINNIYEYKYETLDRLKEIEYLNTHYFIEGIYKEIPIESKRDTFSISIYDKLSYIGIKNHDIVNQNKINSVTRNELVTNISIYEIFVNNDITYIYSFYKLLFEENINNPLKFIK